MELIIAVAAFLASLLTFFSGFGLGTLLMPVFAIFFPVETAVSLTAVVHFLNNLFKLLLVGKLIDKEIALKFGIGAVLAAFLGASLLKTLSLADPLYVYQVFSFEAKVTTIKLTIALLLLVFVWLEALPSLEGFRIEKKYVWLGGALSGFFGGLSGNQGALRSIFLLKCGLAKESYIATGVSIACVIDLTRLFVYRQGFELAFDEAHLFLLATAASSAFLGAFIGARVLEKTTIRFVQRLVSVMLIFIALGLGSGLI